MNETDREVIESLFRQFITSYEEHPFFTDLQKAHQISTAYENKYQRNTPSLNLNNQNKTKNRNHNNNSPLQEQECSLQNIHPATADELKELVRVVSSPHSHDDITQVFHHFWNLSLPDTLQYDEESYLDTIKKEKKDYPGQVNILIQGGGPAGLFALNYLLQTYPTPDANRAPRATKNRKHIPRVRCLLVESRIQQPHYRMPFIRSRPFAFGTEYFSFVLPGIYCARPQETNREYSMMVEIRYLELMLYAQAYRRDFPMLFSNQYATWDSIQSLMRKGAFDVLIDATGGRIKDINLPRTPIPRSHSLWVSEYLKKQNLINGGRNGNATIREGVELRVEPRQNRAILVPKKGHTAEEFGQYFIFSEIVNDEGIPEGRMDARVDHPADREWIEEHLHGKCLLVRDVLRVVPRAFQKNQGRDTLRGRFASLREYPPDARVRFWLLRMDLQHALQITDSFKIGKRDCLYVGIGDSIFQSHFVVGAGLGRMIPLTARILNYIPPAFFKNHQSKTRKK